MRVYKSKWMFLIYLLLCSSPAFAYIDPGTGGMLVQAILALVASAVFYFRNPKQLFNLVRNWIIKFFK